ncbi:PcfJ domain-containing protein [Blastopirellula sp. JC732]|uniref:PcfJ domain-containing protein n=1 Tax=Blastopirellula sediminis TaxID=2894196 RepID=A0A9X1MIW3_9BACT|nr:PcfJ domain-containing protein [Blastopirellula sediminis]MCC9609540.1 PcfJ domain-containing protein [Blastopirellula sediminis]MCC9627684.1 PcfJ domain-containing protein [Blastopirellula sediminis]
MANKQKRKQSIDNDRYFRDHLTRLGLDTVEQYRAWCADNGFSDKLRKTEHQRHLEGAHADRMRAHRRLLCKKRDARRQAERLLAIARGEIDARQVSDPAQQRFAESVRQTRCKQEPLAELLKHLLRQRASFLDGAPFYQDDGRIDGNSALEALPLLATFSDQWVRPLDDWAPTSRSGRKQFLSLLHHLLVRYGDMPAFFHRVWFAGHGTEAARQRRWYVRVGAGENFRQCDAPIPFTKRMAHYFLTAPDDASVNEAIRWGQVLGLGGNARLAKAILRTRLTGTFAHDQFWTTVIQWLIRNPLNDLTQVGPIIDYIHFQRFQVAYYYLDGDRNEAGPARQPNFTMKGRSPKSLLREVNRWHVRLECNSAFDVPSWKPSGYPPFDVLKMSKSGTEQLWSIREICSAKELVAEGRKMHHCVATYAWTCSRGERSIWRMEVESSGLHEKALTLEVDVATRTIVQARGKWNRLATDAERAVLREWGATAGLKLGKYA